MKQNKKKGIGAKLVVFLIPLIAISFGILTIIAYTFSKNHIKESSVATLEAQAQTCANSIEAWSNTNISILNTAVKTMETLDMRDDALLSYQANYLETYEDFPNGIYIVEKTGDVLDASGWVPDYDAREKEYYKRGLECKNGMQFVDAYQDDLTKEFVVTATSYSDSINGIGGVVCTDISLSILSSEVDKLKISGNGDAFIMDQTTGTILASKNAEIVGSTASDIKDSFYNETLQFIQGAKAAHTSLKAADGTYLVSYAPIHNTDWVVVVRSKESAVFSAVTQLGVLLLILGVAVILIILFLLIAFIRKITKPITELTNTIVAVTDGDFTADIRVKGDDEVSVMAGSLKQFLEVMRGTIGSIMHISDTIDHQAKGSSAISTELHESASGQAEAMGQMLDNLEELVKSIAAIAEDATSLALVVADTNDAGEKAISFIDDTKKEADTGRNRMIEVTEAMNHVKESMDILEQSITDVGAAAVKIDNITSTIREIADETNLLALNASIEAARAGDAGRGFAVVATQIKSLAETSGDAANEISELITSVTDLITTTVDQSQQSVEQIHSSSKMVDEASEQFNNIYKSIEDTNHMITSMIEKVQEANDVASNMAAITEEQSASAEEIEATACNVQELASMVTTNSANVESDSNDLANTATNLKEQISNFTI